MKGGGPESPKDLEGAMIDAWVQSAARLLRADYDPTLVFRTMTLVGIAGASRSWAPADAARFLCEVAHAVESRRDQAEVLTKLGRLLRDNAP